MPRIPLWTWVATAAGIGLVARGRSAKASRRKKTSRPAQGADDEPSSGPATGGKPQPIAVGLPSDPEVGALLAEMDALFESYGVDTSLMSAREVTRMPKAQNQASAIPPRAYWKRMAKTLRDVVMPLRLEMGIPFQLRGYRPPDYNEAVGGVAGSRHQWFEGLDIYLSGPQNTAANRRLLGLRSAQLFLAKGNALKMGFGAYGAPTPSNVHLGTGYSKRTWREAGHYIAKAQTVS